MQAIILSGGKGTRLHPLTLTTPKPMLPIAGIPHLEYQIRLLKIHGFNNIVFSTGYLHNQIKDYFGDGSNHDVKMQYKEDGDIPLGTAGAIRNCLDLIDEDEVLVLNGDILTNISLRDMYFTHTVVNKTPITIALTPVDDPTQFGVAVIEGRKIRAFIEKPKDNSLGNLINAGIYMMNTAVIANIPEGFSMVENTTFPVFANASMLGHYINHTDYWLDIGTHERYEQAQEDAKKYFNLDV